MKYYKFRLFVDCSQLCFDLFLPCFRFSLLTFSYNCNFFQLGIASWNFNRGWKSPYNQPLSQHEMKFQPGMKIPNFPYKARLMLVCRHQGLFFFLSTPDRSGKFFFFFYHFELEKIALILIYLTWFLSSSPHFTSCVCFFYNMHVTIMNLAYFNPHNPRLAG